LASKEFRAVLAKALTPLVNKSLEGHFVEGLVAGAEVLVMDLPDLVNFGTWNATLRDARVKMAVVESLREAAADARLDQHNFSKAISELAKRSASRIGVAVFEVVAEQDTTLGDTAKLVDTVLEEASLENRSHTQIALDLLTEPASPLIDLLADSCPNMLEFLTHGLNVTDLRWAQVLRRPEVLAKLRTAIRELEPPLTARGVAGQLLGNPALREELLKQATEELAPGFEASVEKIAGPAAEQGVENLAASVIARL
jgi:hypothetical protein